MERKDCRVVIAGGGVSGLTCAIYLARAGYPVDVYTDEENSLSCLAETPLVENFPGFPEGIDGLELVSRMSEQAARNGAVMHPEGVRSVDADARTFVDSHGAVGSFGEFVMAVGVTPRKYSCPGSENVAVHTCAVCDGSLYEGLPVAVIGGGDTAFGAAKYLSGICSRVYVVIRKGVARAVNAGAVSAVESDPNVRVMYNSTVTSVEDNGCGGLKSMTVNGTERIEVAGMFSCIGHDENRVEVVGDGRIFRCGDCVVGAMRQAVIAAGDGARTALEIMSL